MFSKISIQPIKKNYFLLLFSVLVFLLLLWPHSGHCVSIFDGTFLDEIKRDFQNSASGWQNFGMKVAQYIFWTLTPISMCWQFGEKFIYGEGGLQSFFGQFLKFLLVMGFFYWLLLNGPALAQDIMSSVTKMAFQGSGSGKAYINPSDVVGTGWAVLMSCISTASSSSITNGVSSIANSIFLLFAGVIFFIVYVIIAIDIMMAYISMWIIMYFGIFVLGFGGSHWTSDMAIGYFKSLFSSALKLAGLILVVCIAQNIVNNHIKTVEANIEAATNYTSNNQSIPLTGSSCPTNYHSGFNDNFIPTRVCYHDAPPSLEIADVASLLATAVIFFLLSKSIPASLGGLAAGGTSASASLGGTAGMMMGAASAVGGYMGAAAGASLGGAGVVKGLSNAAGAAANLSNVKSGGGSQENPFSDLMNDLNGGSDGEDDGVSLGGDNNSDSPSLNAQNNDQGVNGTDNSGDTTQNQQNNNSDSSSNNNNSQSSSSDTQDVNQDRSSESSGGENNRDNQENSPISDGEQGLNNGSSPSDNPTNNNSTDNSNNLDNRDGDANNDKQSDSSSDNDNGPMSKQDLLDKHANGGTKKGNFFTHMGKSALGHVGNKIDGKNLTKIFGGNATQAMRSKAGDLLQEQFFNHALNAGCSNEEASALGGIGKQIMNNGGNYKDALNAAKEYLINRKSS